MIASRSLTVSLRSSIWTVRGIDETAACSHSQYVALEDSESSYDFYWKGVIKILRNDSSTQEIRSTIS